jgi:hypothetical protein
MARYESDITLFLKQLKKDQPELTQQQLDGRARLWDKAQNVREQHDAEDSQIAQKPYVYN